MMTYRSKLELIASATTQAKAWKGFWYSRLGETSSLGQEYQFSPLFVHAIQEKSIRPYRIPSHVSVDVNQAF